MPVFNNALAGAAGSGGAADYTIERSLRFNDDDSAYLSRTPSSAGNRKTWTFSTWCKIATPEQAGILLNAQNGTTQGFADNFWILFYAGTIVVGDGSVDYLNTNKLRDPSAWYHIVVTCDTTQSSPSDRLKIYINGVESEYTGDARSSISQDSDTAINSTYLHRIGDSGSYHAYFDGYLTETQFLDGLTPGTATDDASGSVTGTPNAEYLTDFGEFSADTGVWNPIEYTGSYNGSGTGTMYSGMLTSSSGFYSSSHTAEKAFDGDLTTGAWNVNNYDNYMEFTPTTPINFTNGVQVNCYAPNGYSITNYYSVDLDGNGLGSETSFVGGAANFNGHAWIDVATGSGTLHKLRIRLTRSGSGSGVEIRAIAINGSGSSSNYLVDGTPGGVNGFHLDFSDNSNDAALGTDSSGNNNTWTVSNLTAITSGPTITSVKAYSVYNGASVSSNYTVDYSDDGSNWTNAFSGVMDNGSACGIFSGTNPGNGSYGAHKYWRYVVGSVVASHHPRVSRIMLSDGTTDYEIASFNADNCTDNGGIPGANTVYSYTFDASSTDSLLDSPSNYEASSGNNGGNYATFNPLHKGGSMTMSNGNLVVNNTTSNLWRTQHPTIGGKTGKYYSEFTFTGNDISHVGFGVGPVSESLDGFAGAITGSYTWFLQSGFYTAGSYTDTSSPWTTVSFNDVYGIAVDLDNSNVSFYKNGTLVGTKSMVNRLDEVYHIFVTIYGGITATANFGQRPFAYTPPTGYKSLCTQNLDDPTIADGSTAFDVSEWVGNQANRSISLGFSPDFVWIKAASNGFNHQLYDIVRGAGKRLHSNLSNTESTLTDALTSFNSDGFSLGADTGSGDVNGGGPTTYYAWSWDGGTSTVSNTDGSVTSQVRVNQTAGFSIVSWTSSNSANGTYDTIGHGLNATPGLVITKRRDTADSWYTAHGFDLTQFGKLNSTDAFSSAGAAWGNGITSSVIGMRIGNFVGANEAMIAYCFAPVAGYSAFGSYTGNASTDGPFVFTGFRPRWVMHKRSDTGGASVGDWRIWDTARDTDNAAESLLFPAGTNGDSTNAAHGLDILSNGFKFRTSDSNINGNNGTYIYAAFAENPFKTARAR